MPHKYWDISLVFNPVPVMLPHSQKSSRMYLDLWQPLLLRNLELVAESDRYCSHCTYMLLLAVTQSNNYSSLLEVPSQILPSTIIPNTNSSQASNIKEIHFHHYFHIFTQ